MRLFPVRQARPAVFFSLMFTCIVSLPLELHAGGGPENVVVVVNSNSWASQTIANQYVELRGIPPSNVIYIDWRKWLSRVNVKTFRKFILQPVLDEIEKRGLSNQIDYITYSTDFPSSLRIDADFGGIKPGGLAGNYASITGLTYLANRVKHASGPLYTALNSNRYRREPVLPGRPAKTTGFRHWYGWMPDGSRSEIGGEHYYLSTMLGATFGRGNSVQEISRYLASATAADATHPSGTIYYAIAPGNDVRTTRRRGGAAGSAGDQFQGAVAELNRLGIRARIVQGRIPSNAKDVQGAVLGTNNFNWAKSGNKILPGAICENFTSFGGILNEGANAAMQPPLSVLLRYGAAGSSGTVVEPFAIQAKFPLASIQVHYARGCSLAEAYYQALYGPYQLLIVGDPLCQPWAHPPKVGLTGLSPGQVVKGQIELSPSAEPTGKSEVRRFDLFVDGRFTAKCRPDEKLHLETSSLADGYHEIRLVGIESSPIATQGRVIIPIRVANSGSEVTTKLVSGSNLRYGNPITLSVSSPGAKKVSILHNRRIVGQVEGEKGTIQIDSATLGMGHVKLQALAYKQNSKKPFAVSDPILLNVQPARGLKGSPPPVASLHKGVRFVLNHGTPRYLTDMRQPSWFQKTGVKAGQPYTMDAYFNVPAGTVYQFRVEFSGDCRLRVDNKVLLDQKNKPYLFHYVPVSLRRGTHKLSITGKAGTPPRFHIAFGGAGVKSLQPDQFQAP